MSSSSNDADATIGIDGTKPPLPAADQTLPIPGLSGPPTADQVTLAPPWRQAPDQTLAHDGSQEGSSAAAAPSPSAAPDQTLAHGDSQIHGDSQAQATLSPEEASSAGQVPLSVSKSAGSFLDPPSRGAASSHAGPSVPGYEILGELGRGAMGVVYRARQMGLKRLVALKMILSGEYASDAQLVRFRTEAEAIARLQHPNIVQVFEIGEHQGLPFFSLEFVEGGCLADQLTENTIAPRDAARIVRKLAEGMTCAHEHGIIHRDLKPANVLMTRDGEPKITDFGLAKKLEDDSGATRAGAIMGTPSYMAPEQAEGRTDHVGPHSDIYALGAILYDLITGRPPFRGASILETLTQVRTTEPVPPARLHPKMPRDLDTICLKCLRKEPQKRYHTARDLAEDLRRFLDGEPILARPVSSMERTWKWCKRRPAAAALIAVCVLSLVLLAVGGVAFARAEQRRADEADRLRHEADAERDRAEEHFKQAREAVDRMLVDVGLAKLAYEPRMEQIRRDLLETAAEFYDRFVQVETASPVVRQEAAIAARKLGTIRDQLGQRPKAEKAYRRSLELLEPLVEEYPEESGYRADLAVTCAALGSLLGEMRRYSDADPLFTRAVELQHKLVEEAPEKLLPRRELARMNYDYGLLEEARGQRVPAVLSMRTALKLRQKLVADNPEDDFARQEVARTWTVLGRLQASTQPNEAEQSLEEALKLLDKLVKKERTPLLREELMLVSNQMGDLLRNTRPKEAGPLFRRAVELGEELVSDFPTVPDYQQELAACCNSLGIWQLAGGRREAAGRSFERGLALKERLAMNFPKRLDYQRDLARSQGNVGMMLQTAGRVSEAMTLHRRSIDSLRRLTKEQPDNAADERELASALVRLASTDPVQAEKLLREALTIQDRLIDRESHAREVRAERGRTSFALSAILLGRGRLMEAEPLQRRAEADFRELIKQHPEEPEYGLNLGMTLNNGGELLRMSGRAKEAEAAWQEAAALLGELSKKHVTRPVYAREQAKAMHKLGVILRASKRPAEAEAQHRQALTIRQRLVERNKGETALKFDLALSHAELGIALAERNRLDPAVDQFTTAIELLDQLHDTQPGDAEYLRELITQHGNFAGLLHAMGREDDAIKHWRRQIAQKEKLPSSPAQRIDLGVTLHELGMKLIESRRGDKARGCFGDAIKRQREALQQAPGNETAIAMIAAHRLGLAEACLIDRDHAAAAKAVNDALAEAPPKWPQLPAAAASLARCVPLAEKDAKLVEKKRKEIAKIYAGRAVEVLQNAFAAGFRDAEALRKAREFDSLRDRADFKELLGKMAKK